MEQITFSIDGRQIVADQGSTILQAALKNDIYIPHLCYHPEVEPSGVCRLCMVDIAGEMVLSCRTAVKEGLDVKTKTEAIDQARRVNIEVLVANHHLVCKGCPGNMKCTLQKLMAFTRLDRKRVRRLRAPAEELPVDTSNPYFDFDPNKCVLCEICVHTCAGIQHGLNIVGRGPKTKIAFHGDSAKCASCGLCVARCPVGALSPPKQKEALKESA